MVFDRTTILMWSLFTSQFGTEKDKVWYFDHNSNDNFNYALEYYLERLWIIPMEKTSNLPYDFESTAYVSNYGLDKYSQNSPQLLNQIWDDSITIFAKDSSCVQGSIGNNKFMNLKCVGEQSQNDFFTCGGFDAINVSVEYLNRLVVTPTIIDVKDSSFHLNKPSVGLITNQSKSVYQKYKTKTAIIANESIQKSTVSWFNSYGSHTEFSKIFLKEEEAVDWVCN